MTKSWTIDALLEKVDSGHVSPWWLRDVLDHFDGDRPELERRIVLRFHEQTEERKRLYLGLVLLHIGHPSGAAELLRGLRHSDDQQRTLALDQFRIFRPADLGHADKLGRLPMTIEELYAAIAPLLQVPTSPHGQIALQFALGPAFEIALQDTRGLLSHGELTVREKVAHSYLRRGRDDGALEVLAAQLLEPVASQQEQSEHWRRSRLNESGYALAACAANRHDRALAARAGVLALQVFQEALRQVPASLRFGYVVTEASFILRSDRQWLFEDPVLDAIAAAPPPDAEQELLTALENPDVPARLRSHVLLRYFDLTGKTPACTSQLLHALVSQPGRSDPSSKLLSRVHERGLLVLETLLLAVRNPAWRYEALRLMGNRPPSTDDLIIVQSLTETLAISSDVSANTQVSWEQLKGIVTTLGQMPTTSADNERITRALLPALAAAERDQTRPWVTQDIRGCLAIFGHAASIVRDDLPPWDAVVVRWRTDGLHAADIAAILQQADLSRGIAPDNLAKLDGWIAQPFAVRSQAYQILDVLFGFERRIAFGAIRDPGDVPAHHELLQQLLAKSVPPVSIEAAQQDISGDHWTVSFQHQGHTREFTARQRGSLMDVNAVIKAVDELMASLGRTDRAFQFAVLPDGNGEWGFFIVADAARFAEVAARLSLRLVVQG